MSKIIDFLTSIFIFQEPKQPQEEFILLKEHSKAPVAEKPSKKDEIKKVINKVSPNLNENLAYLKEKYSIPLNNDVMLREFDITLEKKTYKAFLIFIDGLTDKALINEHILEPLMFYTSLEKVGKIDNIITYIERNLVPQNQLTKTDDFQTVFEGINLGCCVLFVEGANQALILDVKSWEHRTIGKPSIELTIRGPLEAFGETLRINTALIRKNLKNENLVIEKITIGQRSRTPCAVIYLKDLANPNLVQEVKRRLNSIQVDYANDSGIIEQLIEDNPFLDIPQTIATERPDRAAFYLSEGRVAILVDGSPFILIVPATYYDLTHSPEDLYSRTPYGNFIRIIRHLGMMVALLLPSFYTAIITYHHEMIPTDLLFAISGTKERVPFPAVVEVLIMEISFELIREAGIRMPGAIGPTLGIIGALILGQAAVAANIVSPILIIIVAITGLGSLLIPNFSLGLAWRILKYFYIFLGAIAGLFGITFGLFVHGIFLVSQKSFGVPIFVPFAPITKGILGNIIIRPPIWLEEERPDYLNPQDKRKQPKISRGWIKN